MIIRKKYTELHFCCDSSQSTFCPRPPTTYIPSVFFLGHRRLYLPCSMSLYMLFCASIIQNFSAFVTLLGVSDCPACSKDDFGFLWYIAKILAVTLISFLKSEYLSMLILDANVSLSSSLKRLVIVDAILINSGSCSFVSVSCIGH